MTNVIECLAATVSLIDAMHCGVMRSCWLSRDAFNFAFLLPLGLVMVTNIVLFVLIVKGLTCDRPLSLQSTQAKNEMIRLQVLAVICCFILMGEYFGCRILR